MLALRHQYCLLCSTENSNIIFTVIMHQTFLPSSLCIQPQQQHAESQADIRMLHSLKAALPCTVLGFLLQETPTCLAHFDALLPAASKHAKSIIPEDNKTLQLFCLGPVTLVTPRRLPAWSGMLEASPQLRS